MVLFSTFSFQTLPRPWVPVHRVVGVLEAGAGSSVDEVIALKPGCGATFALTLSALTEKGTQHPTARRKPAGPRSAGSSWDKRFRDRISISLALVEFMTSLVISASLGVFLFPLCYTFNVHRAVNKGAKRKHRLDPSQC